MPYISLVRDGSNNLVKGLYRRQATDADVVKFSAQDPGKSILYTAADYGATSGEFTLPYHYQVGNDQLEVYIVRTDGGRSFRLKSLASWNAVGVPFPAVYFEELSSNMVRVVFGTILMDDYIECSIPHTATPGQFRSSVIVGSQNDRKGIVLNGPGDGIVLTTFDGTQYLLSLSPNGVIGVSPL